MLRPKRSSLLVTATLLLSAACVSPTGPFQGAGIDSRSPARGSRRPAASGELPENFASFGVHNFDPSPSIGGLSEDLGVTLLYGRNLVFQGDHAWGVEGWIGRSEHSAGFQVIDPVSGGTAFLQEEPVDQMLGLGGRITGTLAEGRALPYGRLGLLYQYLYDDIVDDDGFGFYVGAGIDFRVGHSVTLGPGLVYTSTELDRFDVDELILGVNLNLHF